MKGHSIYRWNWRIASGLLLLSVCFTIYCVGWEYSTRRYLKGFSDAIIPAAAAPEEKVHSILNWMARGPSRESAGPDGLEPVRDPTQTLNHEALLRVCGTATNAFINLADSGGLQARRLLLLDPSSHAKHVVAEVLVGNRWIVVDPAYRSFLRGPDGKLLTKEDLTDAGTFAGAVKNIGGYDPHYTYERTAHIRLGRLYILGKPIRSLLDRLFPGWEDSTLVSLLAERESLAALCAAAALTALLVLLRIFLRWYGEKRLGVHTTRIRQQVRRAFGAFIDTAG